jgi:thermopsin
MRLALTFLVIGVVLVLVLSTAAGSGQVSPNAASGGTPNSSSGGPGGRAGAPTPTPVPLSSRAAQALAIENRMRTALSGPGTSTTGLPLPNLDPNIVMHGGVISPGYTTNPAPMGVADFGVQSVGGTNVATVTQAQSVEGSLTLNQFNVTYLECSGPGQFTAQLNSVLTNVTLLGNTSYQFWNQNIVWYFGSSHELHIDDSVVNLSSPAVTWSANSVVSGNGSIQPGFGYWNVHGPALHVPEPFSIQLYNNATVVGGDAAVYFNYTITSPTVPRMSGSYDLVVFNSHAPGSKSKKVVHPEFEINGGRVSNDSFTPLDAELVLGGDDDGSTNSALQVNGTMQLFTEAVGSKTLRSVPSAYDFGMETGETVEGVAVWASDTDGVPVVHLGPGPSFQEPLWGVVGAPAFGHISVTFHVSPANAFVFASSGAPFDPNTASWAWIPVDGTARYLLPPGTYSFRFLLSDYHPTTRTVAATGAHGVNLAADPALGVYTPLWAFGNSELAAISQPGGTGTASNPYVLLNVEPGLLNVLFGQYNDYMFPVFPGVFLVNTTDYVSVVAAPPFTVPLTLTWQLNYYGYYLPLTNNLGFNFYEVSHVSLVYTDPITGWFFADDIGDNMSNVIFWNSSYDLIGGNTFEVPSQALLLYGGSHNEIWGNTFRTVLPVAPYPSFLLYYGDPLALTLFESGDLIYNNAFLTEQTAITPPTTLYGWFTNPPRLWTDRWDVAPQPASTVQVVNGWALSGNVLGLATVAGNFWSNYGTASDPYGVTPYTDGGLIDHGGDFHPQTTVSLYRITVHDSGLPAGIAWSVTIDGYTQTTTFSSLRFYEPNGTYAFVVGPVAGYTATPGSGAVILAGASASVHIRWT